jgi:hypothetical protein
MSILNKDLLKDNTHGEIVVKYRETYYKLYLYNLDGEIHADYTHSYTDVFTDIDLNKLSTGGSPVKGWDSEFVKILCRLLEENQFTLYKNSDYCYILDILNTEGNILVGDDKIRNIKGFIYINDVYIRSYDIDNVKIKYLIGEIQKNNYL